MADDIMDDVELTLEERVDVLSQYMDEAQNRIMDLQQYTSIFADCLKDVMLVLYEREKVNEMMSRDPKNEPVKDETLDWVYSQREGAEQLKAPRAGGWVRVTDALPDLGTRVLVADGSFHGEWQLAVREPYGDGWAWMTSSGVCSSNSKSHWLPIPELPVESVGEMMNRLEPVKDETLDLAYSQMSQKPPGNSKASEEKISKLSGLFATEAEGAAYFEGQVIIRDRDGVAFLVECPNSSETGESIESIALIRDEGIFVVGLNGKLLKGWSVPSAARDPREHGAL